MVIKMNQENLNVIQEAINYLKSAKLDTDKNLINYAINYINLAINNYNKENNNVDEDIVKDEHFIYDEKSLKVMEIICLNFFIIILKYTMKMML